MVKHSKHIASVSLGVMGLGFFATMPLPTTLISRILHGGFEAGLVGGLADWFAVTALFRHPLGLPIPHTALLPKNRKKITEEIVSTLENDWLSKESITERLSEIPISEKIIHMIETELQSENNKEGIAYCLSEMINHIDVEQLSALLAKEVKTYLLTLDVKNILTEIVHTLIQHEFEEKSFNFLLEKLKDWVGKEENSHKLGAVSVKALGKLELDGLMQFALHSLLNMVSEEKLGQILTSIILRAVENLQDKDNPFRRNLISLVRNELYGLERNPLVIQELNNWKENWVTQPTLMDTISQLLTKIKQKWIGYLKDSHNVNEHVIPFFIRMIHKIKSDSDMVSKIEKWLHKKIIDFIEDNHSKIGHIVKENLNKLDDETLTHMIESKVGNDLQWIRVNGALCGFLIGIILTLIKTVSI